MTIRLDGITKLYGGRRVVDGLSLEIATGSFTVLVGPSGCGKSTTLRMINAMIPADEGVIAIDGQDVHTTNPAVLRRGIGYVIQSGGLFPHWSVADNIATVPRLLRWKKDRVQERVAELLALVGLEPEMAGRYPHQLSGGQQQRVGVARALAADPPILLMDEPFGALDPVTRRALQGELAELHRNTGKTILFVTHDMEEALRLGDRIVVLESGHVVQDGNPLDIVAAPATPLVRRFVGGEEGLLRLLSRVMVVDAMRAGDPAPDSHSIHFQESLSVALARMIADDQGELAVVDDGGSVLGALDLSDLARVLQR